MNFMVRASMEFLCVADGQEFDKPFKLLQEAYDNYETEVPDELIVWEPFENYSVQWLYEHIENLAESFKEVYQQALKENN